MTRALSVGCLLALAVLATGCRRGQEAELTDSVDPASVDSLFAAYDGDVPGAAVLVLRDGLPIVARAYGLANLETGEPVAPATNFRLASITKQFTATAILQLVAGGRLSLDATLTDLFDGFPAYGAAITVRHLLTHTSGLMDYDDGSMIPDTATVPVLDADVLAMMASVDSTLFPPGSAYRYSNSGYAVLAQIVERVSGERFEDYLRTHLFEPAGMDSTVAFVNGRNTVPKRAFGYAETDSGFIFRDQSLTSAVLGDGGIYSSVVDLAAWDAALTEGTLVDPMVWREAWTPQVPIPVGGADADDVAPLPADSEAAYGFGWRLDMFLGHRRMHHTGSTSGFRNVIQRYPDARTTVIILTNRAGPDVAPLADRLASWVLAPR